MLEYLANLFPLEALSMKDITLKCAALFALCTAQRAQTLVSLDLSLKKCCNNIAVSYIADLQKNFKTKETK